MSWNKWYGGPSRRPTRGPGGRPAPHTRRAFLGGGAVALTLPFLESLRPAHGATAGGPPVRLLYWYAPCGIVMDAWTPPDEGANYTLPTILQPLAPHQDQVMVLTRLANRAAQVPVAGDHARGTGSFLTCMECEHTAGANIRNGVSVDQVVAEAIASQTLFRSLELGTTGGSSVGDCDSGYSCAYTRNVSWLDEDTPNPKITDPGLAFDRLFAGFDTSQTLEQIERRKAWRTSVLDHVLEDANQLQPKLANSDQDKLDEFMTGVRELEIRVHSDLGECIPGTPPGLGLDYAATVRAMSDLTVLALECDMTRVVSFMLENGGSYRSFDFLGVTGGHHELSHHQGNTSSISGLTTINTWEIEQLAYLLDRMKSVVEVDGSTLLDNSLVYFSSEIADGDRHNHDDLPVLLCGSGGGAVQSGRHKRFASEQPMADLFIAMADTAGVSVSSFGQDGTQPLDLT